MSLGIDRAVCWLSGFCFTVGIVALGAISVTRAQETVPPSPPSCERCDQRCDSPLGIDPVAAEFLERATRALAAEFGQGMMFRVTMPRPEFFAEQACAGAECAQGECAHGQVIRLGEGRIDVEHMPAHFAAKFLRLGCPCSVSGECVCGGKAACGAECAAAGKADCKCCPCSGESLEVSKEIVKDEAKCGQEDCDLTNVIIKRFHHTDAALPPPHKLMEQIATLMAEKAAAQAALAVRKEADEQIGEIYEAMAELLADNAALDAKLEAQSEQRKLVEKVTELAAENARLKTHLELAAERAEIAKATSALSLENEKLKLRLAELEQTRAVAEVARTAAKPRSERKQR
jgi:hypothetical protein